ncbi:MAG: serine/threonine-protein phosphatase [Oscillospiraceae bacterium]|nr:serine/threonine-protein phosphatase [Oscillospiraceae bacterium]
MTEQMHFIAAAGTDEGLRRKGNQDSFGAKILNTPIGEVAVAIMCDGMGGYSKGEVASATVVDAFQRWIVRRLPMLCTAPIQPDQILEEWTGIVELCNEKVLAYGEQHGVQIGTTALMMLAACGRYVILNVGDCRAYEVTEDARQITLDQTLTQAEVNKGILTPEEALTDPRNHILLQCIGVSGQVKPDYYVGDLQKEAVYLLCCDGFRHEIDPMEITDFLHPSVMTNPSQMQREILELIHMNMERKEYDNISAIAIRTMPAGETAAVTDCTVRQEFCYTSSLELA